MRTLTNHMSHPLAVNISTTILTVLVDFAPTTQVAQVMAGQDLALESRVQHL
jgi:hypothetical protein